MAPLMRSLTISFSLFGRIPACAPMRVAKRFARFSIPPSTINYPVVSHPKRPGKATAKIGRPTTKPVTEKQALMLCFKSLVSRGIFSLQYWVSKTITVEPTCFHLHSFCHEDAREFSLSSIWRSRQQSGHKCIS